MHRWPLVHFDSCLADERRTAGFPLEGADSALGDATERDRHQRLGAVLKHVQEQQTIQAVERS